MNHQKPLIITLCIVNIILGLITFSQQKQIESLRQDINILESTNDKEHRSMKSDIDDVESKASDLENKIEEIEGNVEGLENTSRFNALMNF